MYVQETASLLAQLVKNMPAMRKGKATHSGILAWRIPRSHEKSDTTEQLSLHLPDKRY